MEAGEVIPDRSAQIGPKTRFPCGCAYWVEDHGDDNRTFVYHQAHDAECGISKIIKEESKRQSEQRLYPVITIDGRKRPA